MAVTHHPSLPEADGFPVRSISSYIKSKQAKSGQVGHPKRVKVVVVVVVMGLLSPSLNGLTFSEICINLSDFCIVTFTII